MKRTAVALLGFFVAGSVFAEPPGGQSAGSRASLGVVFETALAAARQKLESPACRLVLTDFRDASGRTLEENLAATGLPAPEFLAGLTFLDGRNESVCKRTRVAAFTSVGGAVVWTCPRGSLALGGENARAGANVLIHEMLHTLGLDENPPTSQEINQRVRERCGL